MGDSPIFPPRFIKKKSLTSPDNSVLDIQRSFPPINFSAASSRTTMAPTKKASKAPAKAKATIDSDYESDNDIPNVPAKGASMPSGRAVSQKGTTKFAKFVEKGTVKGVEPAKKVIEKAGEQVKKGPIKKGPAEKPIESIKKVVDSSKKSTTSVNKAGESSKKPTESGKAGESSKKPTESGKKAGESSKNVADKAPARSSDQKQTTNTAKPDKKAASKTPVKRAKESDDDYVDEDIIVTPSKSAKTAKPDKKAVSKTPVKRGKESDDDYVDEDIPTPSKRAKTSRAATGPAPITDARGKIDPDADPVQRSRNLKDRYTTTVEKIRARSVNLGISDVLTKKQKEDVAARAEVHFHEEMHTWFKTKARLDTSQKGYHEEKMKEHKKTGEALFKFD